MNRKLLIVLVLACSNARAIGLFVAPVPSARGIVTESDAEIMTRAIESAVLKRVRGVDVVTPRALDTSLELDLLKACRTGDDAACVVDFAHAMGVHYVLRSQLARLGDRSLLTIALYDGQRAALLAQGQRQASSHGDLLASVPDLVLEVATAADLSVVPKEAAPYVAIAEIAGGSAALLGSMATHFVALLVIEPAYARAELSRQEASTWELARPLALGGPVVGYIAGALLVGVGVYALTEEDP